MNDKVKIKYNWENQLVFQFINIEYKKIMSVPHSVQNRQTLGSYVEYLNKIIDKRGKIFQLQNLSDGIILNQILSDVNQLRLDEIVSQPATLVDQIKNIKSIIKALQGFWVQTTQAEWHCEVDVIQIAKNKSVQQICKLVKLIVRTLFSCQRKDFYIQKVLQTSQQTQQFFMGLLKQQAQVQDLQKSPSASAKNNSERLYDKLLELENQNEQLLKLVEQIQRENLDSLQKQNELYEKLDQKNDQIKKLQIQLSQLTQAKFITENEEVVYKQNQGLNETLYQKINEFQDRQKAIDQEMQSLRELLNNQAEQLKMIPLLKQQLDDKVEQQAALKKQNRQFQKNLSLTKQTLQKTIQKVKRLQQQAIQKASQVTNLQSYLTLKEEQVLVKQQVIQQLQNNIKYLIQTQNQPSQQQGQISTIKEQCKQIVQKHQLQKTKEAVILRLKRQNQNLARQLQVLLIQNETLEKQIQRIKVFEEQNKKLVQMISHLQKYRGEENEVLIHSLYRLRMRLLSKQMIPDNQNSNQSHRLKQINRKY